MISLTPDSTEAYRTLSKKYKTPTEIAAEIVEVQPMSEAGKAFCELYQILKDNPDKHLVITSAKIEPHTK